MRSTPNIEPSVLTMVFATDVTTAGSTRSSFIDLSQVASLLNRRFYRQGLNWAVAGFKFLTSSGQGSVTVTKLPNTWVMANSWTKAFENWRERIDEAFGDEEDPSLTKGRFLDFKIYADADHHQLGFDGNLLPFGRAGVSPTPGSWISSKVRIENPSGGSVAHELVAVGPNYPGVSGVTSLNAVSLIDGYAASRRLPEIRDPNTPADLSDISGTTPENWMRGMSNTGGGNANDFIVTEVTGYDLPPYPFENDGTSTDTMYPGGANQMQTLEVHDLVSYTSTSIGAQAYAKGGNFPCGLIRLDHQVADDSIAHNLVIQIDLMPGNHRGYLAEPMGDM